MGKEKTTQETQQAQSQTYQMSPEEKEMYKLSLDQAKASQPYAIQGIQNLGEMYNKLFTGQQIGGYFQPLVEGISELAISDLSKEAVADISPALQQSGLIDSGVNARLQARTAGDIRRAGYEYNLNNLFRLLGLITTGQTQATQLGSSAASTASGIAKGTGTTTGTTSGMSTTTSMNPFLKSFQTGMGPALSNWYNPTTYM